MNEGLKTDTVVSCHAPNILYSVNSIMPLLHPSRAKPFFPLYGLKVMWDNFPFLCNRHHDSCDGIPAVL